MHKLKYVIYKENKYYVSQCLNVDIASFGETVEKSIENLIEAVELYFEGQQKPEFQTISEVLVGEKMIHG